MCKTATCNTTSDVGTFAGVMPIPAAKLKMCWLELLEACARPYLRGLGKQSTHSSTDLYTSGEVFMPHVAANACTAHVEQQHQEKGVAWLVATPLRSCS